MTEGYPVKQDGNRLYAADIENMVHIGISRHADNTELTANLPAVADRPIGMLVYVEDLGIYMRWAGPTDLWQPAGLQVGNTATYADTGGLHTSTTISTDNRTLKVPLLINSTYMHCTRVEGTLGFYISNPIASPQTVSFRAAWATDNDTSGTAGYGTLGSEGMGVYTLSDTIDLGLTYMSFSYTVPASMQVQKILPLSAFFTYGEPTQKYGGLHLYYLTKSDPSVSVGLLEDATKLRRYPERGLS